MDEQILKDFIEDYSHIVDKEKQSLDEITNEIRNIITITPEFQGSGITDADIANILSGSSQDIAKSINDNNQDVVSSIEDNNQELVKSIDNTNKKMSIDIGKGIKDGSQDMFDYSKNQTDYILGDVKDTITPMFSIFNRDFSGFDEAVEYSKNKGDYILGENKELLSPILGIGKGVMGMFGVEDTQEETNNILDDVRDTLDESYQLQKDQYLSDQRDDADEDPKKGMSWLTKMGIVGVLGLLAGGAVGAFMLPFKIVGDLLVKLPIVGKYIEKAILGVKSVFGKIGGASETLAGWLKAKIFGKIRLFLTSLEKGGVFFTKVFRIFDKVMDIMGGFAKILGFVFSKFSVFIKAFKIGFAKLAWPFQIILSLFDFISGWMKSAETTWIGKLKDGLKNVVFKFLEFPVRLLGWVIEKLSFGLFKNGGDKFVAGLKWILDNIFGAIFLPFEAIWEVSKWVGDKIGTVVNWIVDSFENLYDMFMTIVDAIRWVGQKLWEYSPIMLMWKAWKGMFSFLTGKVGEITDWIKSLPIFQKIKAFIDPIINFFDKVGDFIGNVIDFARKQLTKIPLIGKLFMSGAEETENDKSAIQEAKQNIDNIQKRKAELEAKEAAGEKLSRFEKREIERANEKIADEKESIKDISKDIKHREGKRIKSESKTNIKDIFKSGVGVDDFGANKIVDKEGLSKYSTEELNGLLQHGNWESDSIKMIQDAINKKVEDQTTYSINGVTVTADYYKWWKSEQDKENKELFEGTPEPIDNKPQNIKKSIPTQGTSKPVVEEDPYIQFEYDKEDRLAEKTKKAIPISQGSFGLDKREYLNNMRDIKRQRLQSLADDVGIKDYSRNNKSIMTYNDGSRSIDIKKHDVMDSTKESGMRTVPSSSTLISEEQWTKHGLQRNQLRQAARKKTLLDMEPISGSFAGQGVKPPKPISGAFAGAGQDDLDWSVTPPPPPEPKESMMDKLKRIFSKIKDSGMLKYAVPGLMPSMLAGSGIMKAKSMFGGKQPKSTVTAFAHKNMGGEIRIGDYFDDNLGEDIKPKPISGAFAGAGQDDLDWSTKKPEPKESMMDKLKRIFSKIKDSGMLKYAIPGLMPSMLAGSGIMKAKSMFGGMFGNKPKTSEIPIPTNISGNDFDDWSDLGDWGDDGIKSVSTSPSVNPDDVTTAKVGLKKKSMGIQERLGNIINNGMKKLKDSNNQPNAAPVVINNNSNNNIQEPPEDIESMSILWLNKSYGLG